MERKILILTVLTLSIMVSSCNKKTETENKEQDNPLLQEWTTEYGVPPFDKIKTEHYIPAFEEAMKVNKEEIDAIVNNPEAPTFENTIEALEESGSLLTRVETRQKWSRFPKKFFRNFHSMVMILASMPSCLNA